MIGGKRKERKSPAVIYFVMITAVLLMFMLGSNMLWELSYTVATGFFSYVYTKASTFSLAQTLEN